MSLMNRLGNAGNRHQGERRRVLCVCSAGLLRSPSAAYILSQEPFGFNTRAVGATEEFALIPVDEVLLSWADEVVFMENRHFGQVSEKFDLPRIMKPGSRITVLNVPDQYTYRDPDLLAEIVRQYVALSNGPTMEGQL